MLWVGTCIHQHYIVLNAVWYGCKWRHWSLISYHCDIVDPCLPPQNCSLSCWLLCGGVTASILMRYFYWRKHSWRFPTVVSRLFLSQIESHFLKYLECFIIQTKHNNDFVKNSIFKKLNCLIIIIKVPKLMPHSVLEFRSSLYFSKSQINGLVLRPGLGDDDEEWMMYVILLYL